MAAIWRIADLQGAYPSGGSGSVAGAPERPLTGTRFFRSARLCRPRVTGCFRCTADIQAVDATDSRRVGQRQQGERSHRRKADPQVEHPDSRRPRSAVADPNLPARLLQSGRTASHRFSCFASTKRPFVISHTRPGAVVQRGRLNDSRRLAGVIRLFDLPAAWLSLKWPAGGPQCGKEMGRRSARTRPQAEADDGQRSGCAARPKARRSTGASLVVLVRVRSGVGDARRIHSASFRPESPVKRWRSIR